ncbi:hypothetical protein CFOL_v3_32969, partial [Cephalotus follicularis]
GRGRWGPRKTECWAANCKVTRTIADLGKRVVNGIWTTQSSTRLVTFSSFCFRRAAHTSVYDKNLEDLPQPTAVPDDVIPPSSDKYWAPHPRTGVFGPATEQISGAGGDEGSLPDRGVDSVLEEKAWFRPTSLEDLEKPHHL